MTFIHKQNICFDLKPFKEKKMEINKIKMINIV